jgi:hypothetical protein
MALELKTGVLAYYDGIAVGLIPVKVLSVTAPDKPPLFDLGIGYARWSIKVTAQVTENCGLYKKGEILESNSADIFPRKALFGRYKDRIACYTVVPAEKHQQCCDEDCHISYTGG